MTGTPVTVTVGGAAARAVLTGLVNNTAYTVTVRAVNAVGAGALSASATVTPVAAPAAPTNVVATRGNAQVGLTWTAPLPNGGPAITSYQVQVRTGTTVIRTVTGLPVTPTSTTVTALTNGTAYNFRVLAVNAGGPGAPSLASNTVTPATTPGAPTAVAATGGNTQATVTWTAPANTGGSAITSYQVVVTGGPTPIANVNVGPALRTAVVTGLTNGTVYTFRVRAVNVIGNGTLSAPATAAPATATPAPTAPLAPTNVTATRGNTQATVAWTAAGNGGSPITSYQVQVITGGTVIRTVTGLAATATSTVVTGLTNGTSYTFRVRAVSALGLGTLSAASNAVTPATVPTTPITIGATSGVAGGAINATATWQPPTSNGGSPITGYVVTAIQFNNALNPATITATLTSATLPAGARSLVMVLPAGNYEFTVRAINAVGQSGQSSRSPRVIAR